MRAQQAGRADPDRHERPATRPGRPKKDAADEDDGPTIVDEENNNVSKEEYETLLKGQETEASTETNVSLEKTAPEGTSDPAASSEPSKQELVGVGRAPKKRKAAKIVGDTDSARQEGGEPQAPHNKPKKRTKPVALSFGDEAG